MKGETHEEPRELIAAARAILEDLVEEGLDGFARVPLPAPSPSDSDPTSTSEPAPVAGVAPASTRRAEVPGAKANEFAPTSRPVTVATGRAGLESLRETLGDCQRCGLARGRTHLVFGDGNPDADLMFIGEAPGETEDLRGLPFVGRAGELLTQMIEKGLGIPRSEVYICNIVKCRPPQNRVPLPPEVAACRPFLEGQIDAVRPKVIITLGKPAAGLLLGREVAITRLRGTWQEYRGIPLMPTLHPAYLLRQYTPENRRNVWEDLKAALARSRE